MKLSRSRLTCRAHNRFSPSNALWQHFVARDRPFPTHQRLSSAVAKASQHSPGDHVDNSGPEAAHGADEGGSLNRNTVEVRRMTTVKGRWFPDGVGPSIALNTQKKPDSRPNFPKHALATAKTAYKNDQDYEGIVVQPVLHKKGVKESELPWTLPLEERKIPGIDRLTIEIERFCAYAQPSHYEAVARRKVIEQVKAHTLEALPEYALEIFGSQRTGLVLATSDIDLRLVREDKLSDPEQSILPPTPRQRHAELLNLQDLHSSFKSKSSYLRSRLLHARYPLIALQDLQSGVDIQVVLCNDTSLQRDLMNSYMEQYPYLRKLYFVIKTMFDIRGLSDVFRGGIGSYSLFIMIVASIRHCPYPPIDTAGGLLNFLKFYSTFDTTKQGLSIEPVRMFDKSKEQIVSPKVGAKLEAGEAKPLAPYMLCLRDPADPTNDLGRKAVAIKHVQKTINHLYFILKRDVYFNTRVSILGPLLGSSYMLNKSRRHKLSEYGRNISKEAQADLAAIARQVREGTETQRSPSGQEVSKSGEKEPKSDQKAPHVMQKESNLQKVQNDQENIQLYIENIQQELENVEEDVTQRLKAQRGPVSEHGDADASLQELPAKEVNPEAEKQLKDSALSAEAGHETEKQSMDPTSSAEANPETEKQSMDSTSSAEADPEEKQSTDSTSSAEEANFTADKQSMDSTSSADADPEAEKRPTESTSSAEAEDPKKKKAWWSFE